MPRAGLTRQQVVTAAAELADEEGFQNVTMAQLAARLGVRTPSLYKHTDGLAQLQHDVAALAMGELADHVRDALQGKAGPDALSAFARAFRDYITTHPGRYAATLTTTFTDHDDPLHTASARVLQSVGTVIHGYNIPDAQTDHAVRTLRSLFHGFASLQAADAFHWTGDPEDTFTWMLRFVDAGLRALGGSSDAAASR